MPTSVRFYRDILGSKIARSTPPLGEDYFHWAMLRLGDAQFMLNTIYDSNDERPAQPDRARTPSSRDVWLYFDCPDVEAAYQELRNKGVELEEPSVTYYGMKQVSLLDPDGYRVIFQQLAD